MTEQAHSIETIIAQAKGDTRVEDAHAEDTRVPDTTDPNTGVSGTSVSGTNVPNWRDMLPEDLRNTPSLAKFKDVESLAKSYLEGEKTFSSRIAIPKEDAPDADWEAFYKKMGRPEDKKYVPDGDRAADEEALLTAYEGMLYDSGLNLRQGRQVFAKMRELSAKMEEEGAKARESERQENLKTLEKAFGDQMDARMNQIKAALGKFGADASGNQVLAALVEQTNYNPYLVQFLSSVGESLASDRLVTGDAPLPLPTSRQAALVEIKRLESDEAFQLQYRGSDVEKRQEAIKRMDGLYKVAYRGETLEGGSTFDR